MAKDGHITISDRAEFVTKIDAIKAAAAELRAAAKLLAPIAAKAKEEAASFTQDGNVAPVYADTVAGLQAWAEKLVAHAESVAGSGENAAQTAYDKFLAIIGVDDATAAKIKNI